MKYSVVITKQANIDLRGIYEYICFTLLSPENAASQMDRLEKSIYDLDTMPFRFREYEYEPWKSRGMHIMPVDNYVVAYIPNEQTGVVTIIRVLYGGSDVKEHLSNHTDLNKE